MWISQESSLFQNLSLMEASNENQGKAQNDLREIIQGQNALIEKALNQLIQRGSIMNSDLIESTENLKKDADQTIVTEMSLSTDSNSGNEGDEHLETFNGNK